MGWRWEAVLDANLSLKETKTKTKKGKWLLTDRHGIQALRPREVLPLLGHETCLDVPLKNQAYLLAAAAAAAAFKAYTASTTRFHACR